ncbi:SpvB/TcaC N-terminal domain-containing protein [Luteibacter sp. SG786]|uniref:SpvB/TcaC N-terminal domain-containing protein n=1 Tax=Luteibacter sp. SG786 TaxID=2587130 RepID=UPI00141EE835|nr:SpvB/TcaC N-terminal domain-containing protein [Luteibacter sp. SG786]NII54894.1 hypothetical protein [Luteibacter sp. SG786]
MDMQTPDLSLAAPSLPRGGGAIQSIGHGWGAVGATGGASLEIPLPASGGRSLVPSMSLIYGSQAGRSAFGQGWGLPMPAFARRISKGVPTYGDDDEFVGPDGDVLVPERDGNGDLVRREATAFRGLSLGSYQVQRYYPRVEKGGLNIESWRSPSDWFWMIHEADGTTHVFGKTARTACTIDGKECIAQWWLEHTVAVNGEQMRYEYKREDGEGLDDAWPSRDRANQWYVHRVLYGNETGDRVPGILRPDDATTWLFELLFDYGERATGLTDIPTHAPAGTWPVRQDAFSSFAFGFEVRTLRLCRQVLMFHRFPELGADPLLVRRLLLEYDENEYVSYLAAAHEVAYDAQGRPAFSPPLEFRYSGFAPPEQAEFQPFPGLSPPESSLPGVDDGLRYQLVDLYGEGMAGVLHPAAGGWYYREPMRGPTGGDEVVYDHWQQLPRQPAAGPGLEGRMALADLTGDGKLEWVVGRPGAAGYFTLSPDRTWGQFVPFAALPTEFAGTRGQLADLGGAGLSDFAVIGTRSVRWYANARAEGFAPPVDVPHDLDYLPGEGDGRSVLVAFGDVLGSGQQHLLRIRHDDVSVWPNLGRGKFGARMEFARLPFDAASFDAARVRLADLDGSGVADLIYLEGDHALVFMNRSGHGFADPVAVPWPEGVRFDRLCEVSAADLQGLGCASLVLTVPHMTPRHWYCDFSKGVKPHMLVATNNNVGTHGEVDYRSSAQEWLDEKQERRAAGKHVACALPFPVHVVAHQRQIDEVTGQQLSQHFQYRGGYYDGHEREFRGFGVLYQHDTEIPAADTVLEDGFTAPVRTTTWFHVGRVEAPEDDGFDSHDPDLPRLRATLHTRFDADTGQDVIEDPGEEDMLRQFARALSGAVRRVEVHGLDDEARPPYSVDQQRYMVRLLREPLAPERHAVLQLFTVESLSCQYDRLPSDPRITHTIGLRWDERGALCRGVVVYYARRGGEPPFEEEFPRRWWEDSRDTAQDDYYITETLAEWIHLDDPEGWRSQLPYRARSNAFLIPGGDIQPGDINHERFSDPDGPIGASRARTLAGLSVQRYQGCEEGQASFAALPDYTETAELDETALQAYADVMTPEELEAKLQEVGYFRMQSFLPEEGAILWSVQRGFATFAPLEAFHRVVAHRLTRDLGETQAEYDPHSLFITRVTLPDGCATDAEYDYRTLLPRRIVDANRNTQEAAYDALGRVVATSFFGTEMGQPVGFAPISDYQRPFDFPDEALADPERAIQDAATVAFYAPFAWMGQVSPPAGAGVGETDGRWLIPGGYVRASARWRLADGENPEVAAALLAAVRRPPHAAVLVADRYPGDPEKQIRRSVADSDGFGRVLQQKQFVEPGEAYVTSADGGLELDDAGQPVKAPTQTRWRVSERVEYNNKGLVVRTYRPYFADTHHYIHDEAFRAFGYCDRQYYDPLGRPTVTWTAAGWMRRQTYWPWYTIAEDENDTAEEVLEMRAASASG